MRPGAPMPLMPPNPDRLEIRSEEEVCDHGEGQRDHQEVDAGAPARQRAEQECHGRREDDSEDDPEPWIPAKVQALRVSVRDHVAEGEAGDAEDRDLAERDHPTVCGKEDQARRDDAEEEDLRQDEADPVGAEDDRPERGQYQSDHPNGALDDLAKVHDPTLTRASRTAPGAGTRGRARAVRT